jgi:creatinine amidohydrolase/Fe(II)-dependent formamide hydrolase-like protein
VRNSAAIAFCGTILLAGLAFGSSLLPTGTPPQYTDARPIDTGALPFHLEELTWPEVRALMADGYRTAILPTGGVEQNGPHMVLGKHNYIVRHTAERVARARGNTLVAPVIAYVPEGDADRRTGHMAFPGTMSVPENVFAATLEAAARSLRAHGFTAILFLGDSYGNQPAQRAVAKRLDAEWKKQGVRVMHVGDYYAGNGQVEWLRARGENNETIGGHAGIRDTSELLTIYPGGIRPDRVRPHTAPGMANSGINGDPTRASAERGRVMLQLKVDAALRQIRAALGSGR